MPWTRGNVLKSWLALGWVRICFNCRNSSGPKRRWFVMLGAIMVSPSEPLEVLRRGDHSPAHVQCLCRLCCKGVAPEVLGDDAARDGVKEAVHDYCIAFFVDDGLVAARCPAWLQSSFNILIKLFERIGLLANSDKTKVVTCVPGRI